MLIPIVLLNRTIISTRMKGSSISNSMTTRKNLLKTLRQNQAKLLSISNLKNHLKSMMTAMTNSLIKTQAWVAEVEAVANNLNIS